MKSINRQITEKLNNSFVYFKKILTLGSFPFCIIKEKLEMCYEEMIILARFSK